LWFAGRSATAAATAITLMVVIAVDEQQNDDDEHQPGAVVTAKQVSQTHTLCRLLSLDIPYYGKWGKAVTVF